MNLLNTQEKSLFWRGFILLLFFLMSSTCLASTFNIHEGSSKVGNYQRYKTKGGETLFDIAYHFDVGMGEMTRVNPHLRHRILPKGVEVIIPATYVLPQSVPKSGIVLNLAQLRVYYFHPNGTEVSTYPVGVGRQGWSTPVGTTSIVNKVRNPTWRPPASIRREAARKGKTLPTAIGPGPKNPLGHYAMHLGFQRILMHGTNAPRTVGLRSSHGCIRMYSKDIEELFSMVPVGTPVRIIYEARK